MSTNVTHPSYPYSTRDWLTCAMKMLTVQIPTDLIIAHASRVTLEQGFYVKVTESDILTDKIYHIPGLKITGK